jgi:osmotically-inducible protein OsmY
MKKTNSLTVIAGALLIVVSLGACAAISGRETGTQYVDDATLTTRVKADIVKDQSLKGFEIHVETMQDTVQLSGFVDTAQQKNQAGQIAAGGTGVIAVRNNILVRQ